MIVNSFYSGGGLEKGAKFSFSRGSCEIVYLFFFFLLYGSLLSLSRGRWVFV